MEQYWMPKELDFKNLRKCLDNYVCNSIYIRLFGSSGGTVKVNEKLAGRKLDFEKTESGLSMLIDLKKIFHFPLVDYVAGFSLAYERIKESDDGIERMIMLSHGIDPYDSKLPEPCKSILRTGLDNHLMEIEFSGRVDLKLYLRDPPWTYWTVCKPDDIRNAILKQEIEYGEEDC